MENLHLNFFPQPSLAVSAEVKLGVGLGLGSMSGYVMIIPEGDQELKCSILIRRVGAAKNEKNLS